MSDTPKFEVIDRRKLKAAEEGHETSSAQPAAPPAEPEVSSGGPRLVVNEPKTASETEQAAPTEESEQAEYVAVPTAEEAHQQKLAFEAAALRLEELVRAQNPAMGAQPPMTFESLVQQFYVSAMLQMGAGAQEGQRPRVDILGARATIDMLGILAETTRGNLSSQEDRALQSVLYEVRMAFLELTSMINLQAMQPPQPPPPKR